MPGTPVSKILETIEEVARLQDQFAALDAAIEQLILRVEALERALRMPPSPP